MEERKECPRCGAEMDTLLFMGLDPEFHICPACRIAYDVTTGEPVAEVF